jgi:hypothetical protein
VGRAARAVLLGLAPSVLERRPGVRVDELTRLDPLEAMSLEESGVRCFQQRPGNSAGPEIDVPSPFVADRVLDGDVGDLHPTARSKHAEKLVEDGVFVRY